MLIVSSLIFECSLKFLGFPLTAVVALLFVIDDTLFAPAAKTCLASLRRFFFGIESTMYRISLFAFVITSCLFTNSTANADLVWTGAVDGVSAFQEANWLDDNGQVPGAGEIDGNTVITAATGGKVVINSGTGSPASFSNQFRFGDNDVEVSGGKVLGSNNNFGIFVDDGGSFGNLLLDGGSTINVQFAQNFTVTMDGGSTFRFRGAGNPVNNTTINVLDFGSLLRFDNETFAAFEAEHSSKVTLNSATLEFGADPFAIEAGDNALATAFNGADGVDISFVNAIPEPTSAAVLSLVGLLALGRRRR